MRVLQVHTDYRSAGGEHAVVRHEAALLRRLGHEVVEHRVENPTGVVATAATLALAPANPLAARAASRAAAHARPDVVHVHNTWFALSPAVLSAFRRAGLPVVMTLHNYRVACAKGILYRDGAPCEACVGSHPWHAVRHGCWHGPLLSVPAAATIALHRGLDTYSRAVDVFLALNPIAREVFMRAGLPADRIRVKPNAVPDPGPRPAPPTAARTVLYVGRLSAEKGVDTLLAAWRLLGHTTLELAIVGDGPLRASLERQAPPGVRFTGWVSEDEVGRLMLSARALALPVVSPEGAPIVGITALGAGLPVVASRIGALPDMLGSLGDAWLAPPGDAHGWAAALRAVQDDAGVDAAGARARALYERAYSEPVLATALLDAYDAARARHRPDPARTGD